MNEKLAWLSQPCNNSEAKLMHWILHNLAITTGIFVALAVAIAIVVFRFLRRAYGHESRVQFETGLVGLAVTVLFSVILNHFYAEERQFENRQWALQDQHFAQLKPILKGEADTFQALGAQLKREGHASDYNNDSTAMHAQLAGQMWRDVMSPDLKMHFPEYEKLKQSLARQIQSQDDEFRSAILEVKDQIKRKLNESLKDTDALSFVEQCLGHGDGVKIILSGTGFNFNYYGGLSGGSGEPSPDQVAAFEAYRIIRPSANLLAHCESLKRRSTDISSQAEQLSKKALLLADGTVLPGECEFIKMENF